MKENIRMRVMVRSKMRVKKLVWVSVRMMMRVRIKIRVKKKLIWVSVE